ncbi:MAG: thioredoxin fold domain-containing protein, partial [Pseudomonadota bacterium]
MLTFLQICVLALLGPITLAYADDARRQVFEQAMQQLNEGDLTILSPATSPRSTVNVFVDTSCTFNKSLHRELQKLVEDRIKVRYIAFPRAGRQSKDYSQLANVWCQQDRAQALSDAYQDQPIPESDCPHPVDTHQQLAEKLNIRTTPLIVFEDGHSVRGYQNALAILDYIDYGKPPEDSAAFCWAQETPQPFSPIRGLLRQELAVLGLTGGTFDSIDILPAPLVNMYESQVGPYKFVLSEDGGFAMRSNVLDENDTLSELEKRAMRRQAMQLLDEQATIVFPAQGKTRKTLTIFTDSDCPFCAKLHKDIARLNKAGIKVRYLAFPRGGIDSESYWKMVSVWCHQNKERSLKQALQNNPLPLQTCQVNPVEWHYRMGVGLGVWGTPTVITEDGAIKVGYTPPERLLAGVNP